MLRISAENQVLIFLGVLALGRGIYIVKDECPPNEEYLLCGSACPANCSNLTSTASCIDDCMEGCFCIVGFVRDDNGTCVSADQCGVTPACPEDQEVNDCGSECPLTCAEPTPQPCDKICVRGCFCLPSLILDESSGKCVAPEDCPIGPCLNENEIYDSCSGACEPSCFDPEPICNKICMGGCICEAGLLRNDAGECVSVDKCPSNGTNVNLLAKYLNAIDKILREPLKELRK